MPSPYPRGTASKRTKLVCTLGPAVVGRVEELVRAGMDVARVNFSHGTDDERVRATEEVRRAAEKLGRPIGLLADLPGPKIRLGSVDPDPVTLQTGTTFVLRPSGGGGAGGAAVTHPELASDVRPGDRILLADGAAELRVEEIRGGDAVCEIVRGGEIRSHTGVNVPSERLSLPALTDQDRRDLERADALDFDMVAGSFVRTGDDVRELRKHAGDLLVMAKVETDAATRNFGDICAVADAVMIARGDLGVEIPYEEVPALQKDLTSRANALGVPVVVATQMLESMVEAPRPTRAEASDVANAVWDGTDAVMLSAETAIGAHPVEAAGAAVRILRSAESGGPRPVPRDRTAVDSEPEAIARAASALADEDPRIAAIACFTRTGRTAQLLAATRPRVSVFAFSPEAEVVRRLTLLRGVHPAPCALPPDTDEMIAGMDRDLRRVAEVPVETPVVMVASTPVGIAHTNLLKIHRIGRS